MIIPTPSYIREELKDWLTDKKFFFSKQTCRLPLYDKWQNQRQSHITAAFLLLENYKSYKTCGRVLPFLQAGLQGSRGSNARTRSISQERAPEPAWGRTLLLPQDGSQGTLENDAWSNSIQQEETHLPGYMEPVRIEVLIGIWKFMFVTM